MQIAIDRPSAIVDRARELRPLTAQIGQRLSQLAGRCHGVRMGQQQLLDKLLYWRAVASAQLLPPYRLSVFGSCLSRTPLANGCGELCGWLVLRARRLLQRIFGVDEVAPAIRPASQVD